MISNPCTNSIETETASVKLSIIIPVLNEEKMIGRCLEALQQSYFSRLEFEIIVVDNGSTDRTLEIVHSFRQCLLIAILHCPGVHISALRNLGAQSARGEILAFLDADCIPSREWLAEARHMFQENNAGVIGSFYALPQPSSWIANVWYRYHYDNKVGDVTYVPAGDLFVSRSTFFSVGGFDEELETNEDYDFCVRVAQTGKTIRACPSLAVVHLGTPQTVMNFYRQQCWHGKHVLRVFLQDPSKLHNVRPLLFGFTTLIGLILVLAGAATSLASRDVIFLLYGILALLLLPVTMAMHKAIVSNRWKDAFPLGALYLTYGIARALCLAQRAVSFPHNKCDRRTTARTETR